MSTVPKQVEEAATLAEELHSQMFPSKEAETTEETQETEQEEAQEAAQEEPNKETQEEDTYRRRYDTLKGKYEAEVPRLHSELKELKEKVFERLGDVSKKDAPVAEVKNEKLEQFREEYGDEFIENLRALYQSDLEKVLAEKFQPVQEKITSVEDTQIKVAQENFMTFLDGEVKGDWRKLWAGEDKKFIDFLAQPDPSGLYTYGELVQAYNDNWDGQKLSKVFNAYFSTGTPQKQEVPLETVPKAAKNPGKEAMVAPSRSTPHATPNAAEKRMWTGEMVREFQRADRMNKYSPEESKAMWDDLLLAPGENRIRG